MTIFTYIPTGKILDWLGITEYKEIAVAKGVIVVETNLKEDFSPSQFVFQFNPEEFERTRDVEYAQRKAPGLDKPTLHYIGGGLAELPLRFFVEDDVDGPPDGFSDLSNVMQWFESLTTPAEKVGRPPIITVSLGAYNFEGVITNLKMRVMKSYNNLLPRFVEINAALIESN